MRHQGPPKGPAKDLSSHTWVSGLQACFSKGLPEAPRQS